MAKADKDIRRELQTNMNIDINILKKYWQTVPNNIQKGLYTMAR